MRELLKAGMAPEASRRVREYLTEWLAQQPGTGLTVAAFAPLPGEVDLLPLLESTRAIRWCFPRVLDGDLKFFEITDPSDLTTGAYSIPEPSLDAPEVPHSLIDVFLVPGLAFDLFTGDRLGRGKGYYDRSLAMANPRAIFIGVGLSRQIASVPTESHDFPMGAIVTESGLSWISMP
jgi:5-formyltetrahydrofolate cyclo-ligase